MTTAGNIMSLTFSKEANWNASTICIIGTLHGLEQRQHLLQNKIPGLSKVYMSLVAQLKPGTDLNGDSVTQFVQKEGNEVQKAIICAVTSFCTRHNSPARSDQVVNLLNKVCPKKGHVQIVFLLDNPEFAYPYGCATARCFPLYSRKAVKNLDKQTKAENKDANKVNVSFYLIHVEEVNEIDLARISLAAESIRYASKLVDMPTCELNTTVFINKVKKQVDKVKGIKMTVIKGEELVKEGLGGIYAVGKAANEPPALVILSYTPDNVPTTTTNSPGPARNIVWVGKGIVYDTGGLSLKPREGMLGMKRDMGGSAAVFSAFMAAVKYGNLKCSLHALLCLAENAIGPNATRPDDIIHMYSGKTVEVNNPDAEGRIVLGDGVAYAVRHLHPNVVIDLATLTGAQGISTGKLHGAIVCNDDHLEHAAVLAGKASGDLVFPLLYCPELLRSEYASDMADMKNSVKDRANAQSSCAAQFIANHLGDNYSGKWLHVDMAYPAFNGERATGYGVALLLELLKNIDKVEK